jgi:hypothetical protein
VNRELLLINLCIDLRNMLLQIADPIQVILTPHGLAFRLQ